MYKVVKKFSGANVGDVIDLNARRAVSELRNGNVVKYVKPIPKPKKKTKEQKFD